VLGLWGDGHHGKEAEEPTDNGSGGPIKSSSDGCASRRSCKRASAR